MPGQFIFHSTLNKSKLKRPTQVFVFHGLWILFAGYRAFDTVTPIGRYSWIILTIISTALFINILYKQYYIEVTDSQLVINRDFFRTQVLDMKEIAKITIEPSPFSPSFILMKDNSIVKYADRHVNDKELKEVMEKFHIEVS